MNKFKVRFEEENNRMHLYLLIYLDSKDLTNFIEMRVLFDTGAVISVFDKELLEVLGLSLETTNKNILSPLKRNSANIEINTIYKFEVPKVDIGNCRLFNLKLGAATLEDNSDSIIGMDILGHFNFNVNMKENIIEFQLREDSYELKTIDAINDKVIKIGSLDQISDLETKVSTDLTNKNINKLKEIVYDLIPNSIKENEESREHTLKYYLDLIQ